MRSLMTLLLASIAATTANPVVPATQARALDGHEVRLPRDLAPATVLILSFSRNAAKTTTAWAVPVQTRLARTPAITLFNMPMLAEVPSFVRPMVVRSIRDQVPQVARGTFVPLVDHEAEWKQLAGYDPHAADAAYILLLDREGHVQWSTHEAFSDASFRLLSDRANQLAATH